MREYDAATLAYLASRGGMVAHRLIWIEARNRATGAVEGMGITSAEDDLAVLIDGAARAYVGAGALLGGEPITAGSGLEVRTYQVSLSAIAPEVESLVKGYDTRFSRVEIHRAFFDPASRKMVAPPSRVFRGLVNRITFPRGAPGDAPAAVLELASETRALTRTIAARKSHESQSRRGGDAFRKYGDVSGVVPVYWGEERNAPK